jgi:hypothetical protein
MPNTLGALAGGDAFVNIGSLSADGSHVRQGPIDRGSFPEFPPRLSVNASLLKAHGSSAQLLDRFRKDFGGGWRTKFTPNRELSMSMDFDFGR